MKIKGILLFTITMAGLFAAMSAMAQKFPAYSETTFRSETQEYEYKSGVTHGDDLWILVGARARGQSSGPQEYQVWRLDSHGKKIGQFDLKSIAPRGQEPAQYVNVHNLITLRNGDVALLADTGGKLDILVFDGNAGKTVARRSISAVAAPAYTSKVLPASDGDLVLLGRSNGRGALVKLRPSGVLSGRISIDSADLTVVTDAVELADHGFVVLGEHLNEGNQVSSWIGRIDHDGNVIFKYTMPGQDGALSCNPDGSRCVVVYASAGKNGWNTAIRVFNESLAPLWQADLLSGLRLNSRFRASVVSEDSVFVTGMDLKNRLWMALVRRNEPAPISSGFEEPSAKWQRVWNYDLLSTPRDLVVPFTELLVGEEMEQRQVLKVLRLQRTEVHTISARKP